MSIARLIEKPSYMYPFLLQPMCYNTTDCVGVKPTTTRVTAKPVRTVRVSRLKALASCCCYCFMVACTCNNQ